MSDYIRTINTADQIGALYKQGDWSAALAVEALVDLGFYALAVTERGIVGWFNGVRFEMGGENV